MPTYEELGTGIGELVESKQLQYGDSFGRIGEVMDILYPDGINTYQLGDALAITRILDKLFRLAQRKEDGKDLGGESPYRDIAGYGLLGTMKDEYGGVAKLATAPGSEPGSSEGSSPSAPSNYNVIVGSFGRAMEEKLEENRWKAGWHDMDWDQLHERLLEEVDELSQLILQAQDAKEPVDMEAVVREAADIANFAMMAADVFGSLKPTIKCVRCGKICGATEVFSALGIKGFCSKCHNKVSKLIKE